MERLAGIWLLSLLVAGAAVAESSVLRRLETGDDSRGYEAVGRVDLMGRGFCTGALIAPDLVLTAAHCLFDRASGERIADAEIEFLAGWRNGRAAAYRNVRQSVVHPEYDYSQSVSASRVSFDMALLRLQRPIRNTTVLPFETAGRPEAGDTLGVVSYGRGRADAPSMQDSCSVIARERDALVMSCDVEQGSSGAPVFSFADGRPRIVSVVSAMAEMDGGKVSLGTVVEGPLRELTAHLDAASGPGSALGRPPVQRAGERNQTGAKFIRP